MIDAINTSNTIKIDAMSTLAMCTVYTVNTITVASGSGIKPPASTKSPGLSDFFIPRVLRARPKSCDCVVLSDCLTD